MIYSHANLHCVEVTVPMCNVLSQLVHFNFPTHNSICLAHSVISSKFFLHTSQWFICLPFFVVFLKFPNSITVFLTRLTL